jgi:hypothetical protein
VVAAAVQMLCACHSISRSSSSGGGGGAATAVAAAGQVPTAVRCRRHHPRQAAAILLFIHPREPAGVASRPVVELQTHVLPS